MKELK